MTDKLQQESVARWMPPEGTLLERSAIGWFVRYEDHLAAATAHEKELATLRAELAKVTEQRDAWPKYHGIASDGLMILHDRKDLQDLAGLRCGDFMANAVPHMVAEIDRLRARVAELEKWREGVPVATLRELDEWELGLDYPDTTAISLWLAGLKE